MSNPKATSNVDAPIYNIKAVVSQTGLNPATLRAWERRYGFPHPQRTEGGHRLYTARDIETLKWLIARQEEGVSISHAIELWRSYAERGEDPVQRKRELATGPTDQLVVDLEGVQIDQLRRAWVTSCLSFDREMAEQVLSRAFAQYDPETVCFEVMRKGLAEVGDGWYDGQVTVQQEHFTSALSVKRLELLIAATPPPSHPERIVVATAPGDYHIFSSLLVTFLLRRSGWDVVYLGADIPVDDLEATIAQIRPALVIVSAQLLHTAATIKEIAQALQTQPVTLAFGGLVFNKMPELQKLIPGHFLGKTLEKAVHRAAGLIGQPGSDLQWTAPSETYQRALTQYRERRALIESHVWGTFIATNRPIEYLAAINHDIALTIEAALKLGDVNLLDNDITWIEYLLMSYRQPRSSIIDYFRAYYQAARIHLAEPAEAVVGWLSRLIQDNHH